jgi:hypothetical protein
MKPTAHRAHISIPQFPGSARLRAAGRRACQDPRPSPSASAGDRARLWRPIVLGEPLGRGVMAHVAPLSFDGGHHPVTAHQPMPSLATASPASSTASISCSRTTVLTIASASALVLMPRSSAVHSSARRSSSGKRMVNGLPIASSVRPTQMQSTCCALLQDTELMPQNQNFGFQPPSRLEAVAQHADKDGGLQSSGDHVLIRC